MEQDNHSELMPRVRRDINKIHRKKHQFDNFSEIRIELRQRRKMFLGSFTSLRAVVCANGKLSDDKISELSTFLALRATALWDKKYEKSEAFCRQFFMLAINAIAGGEVGDETMDDLIQLAETLVRSKEIFVYVMKDLLPDDLVSELFELTESYDSDLYTASFEDAVLGAIAIYLGTLKDPIENETSHADEETSI